MEHEIRDFREALIAVLVAASEQLDLDRLLDALHMQHQAYAEQAPQVAAHLNAIGHALTQVAALRQRRDQEEH